MSAQDLEQRARELLGQPYHEEISGLVKGAPLFEGQEEWVPFDEALHAIAAALRQQPAPVDLEQFREAVECWGSHRRSGRGDPRVAAEAKRLLAIIDNAGRMGQQSAPFVDVERVAQLVAHRACCGTEHDPANGKLHGYCVVCGVEWPCEYAGIPPKPSPVVDDAMVKRVWELYWRAEKSGNVIVTEKEMYAIAECITRRR